MTVAQIARPGLDTRRLLELGKLVIQVLHEPAVQKTLAEAYADTARAAKSLAAACGEIAAAWQRRSGTATQILSGN